MLRMTCYIILVYENVISASEMTWRFNPSVFTLRHHSRKANKNLRTNPDIIPYSHDPPGHTCGLPCCSGDLQIQLRVRRQPKSCIGLQDMDIVQQNFTFKRNQLMKACPGLDNGFFSVQQPKEIPRGKIPKFGSLRNNLPTISENQKYHFLKRREITLPESTDPLAMEKLYLQDFNDGESDDILNFESDNEIEYYMTTRNPNDPTQGVPYSVSDLDIRHPWDIIRENKQKADDSLSSNYYEVIECPEVKQMQQNNLTYNRKLLKQSVPQIPPKPPLQNPFNHPPLPKTNNISNHTASKFQQNFNNYKDKKTEENSSNAPKYNTYNTVYSINSFTNQSRKAYDKYQSLNDGMKSGHKSFRRDARDIDFSGGAVPLSNKKLDFETAARAKLQQILQRNESINESRKTRYKTVINASNENRNGHNVNEWGNMRERLVKRQEVNVIGESNEGFGYPEVGSNATETVSSTDSDESFKETMKKSGFKHVNIDGKMHRSSCPISTEEIAARLENSEFPHYDWDENPEEKKRSSLSDNPITLIL